MATTMDQGLQKFAKASERVTVRLQPQDRLFITRFAALMDMKEADIIRWTIQRARILAEAETQN